MRFEHVGKRLDGHTARFKSNPYRILWAFVLIFPLLAFFINARFLGQALGILLAFPIVEIITYFIDYWEAGMGKRNLITVGIHLDKMNAFPLFIIKVVGLFLLSTWFAQVFAEYVSTGATAVVAAYIVLGVMYAYYLFTVRR